MKYAIRRVNADKLLYIEKIFTTEMTSIARELNGEKNPIEYTRRIKHYGLTDDYEYAKMYLTEEEAIKEVEQLGEKFKVVPVNRRGNLK